MANVPLEAYLGFAKHIYKSGDLSVAALVLNKGQGNEKYEFKGDDFILPASVIAGHVQGDDHFLICVLESGSCFKGGVFEPKVWVNGVDGAKGKFDTAAGDALCKEWQESGCIAVIHVNAIPALKVFVKVLSELGLIVRNSAGEIQVKLNLSDEKLNALEGHLATFWTDYTANGATPAPGTPAYASAIAINESGLMALPCLKDTDLPSTAIYDVFGNKSGAKILCFPFNGNLPVIDGVAIELPVKEEKKSSNGGGRGYGSTTVNGFLSPQDRLKFIVEQYNKTGVNIAPDDALALFTSAFPDAASSPQAKQHYLKFLMSLTGTNL